MTAVRPVAWSPKARSGVACSAACASPLRGQALARGSIPDVAEAVASPQRITSDPSVALHVLALAPEVPTLVWGRDELDAHDMWNSNSLVSSRGCSRAPASISPTWHFPNTAARRAGEPESSQPVSRRPHADQRSGRCREIGSPRHSVQTRRKEER
jgi:hypothetical protein